MAHVLVIDDDPLLIPEQVRHAFPAPAYKITVASDGASGLAHVLNSPPDVILLDLRLPDGSGLEVFRKIRAIDARIPVVFVTMAKTADTAIEAMKDGAFNYLYKPLDLAKLQATVLEALDVVRRMRAPVVLGEPQSEADEGGIFGGCPAMLEIYKAIGRVAGQDVTVLITGESGTGKELVARAIYQHSTRAKAPFLAMNCAAIPDALLESELFGHERGAFTGAERRRIGKFEQCNGGTILLDEIGDMPLTLQAKLLRLLQEQRFERVGGNETVSTDVRLIASTHRDLKSRAADQQFRADLYYRLGVFTIHLPPAPRPRRRPPHAHRALPRALQPRARSQRHRGLSGGARASSRVLVARQRSRAAERAQACTPAGERDRPPPRFPAGAERAVERWTARIRVAVTARRARPRGVHSRSTRARRR